MGKRLFLVGVIALILLIGMTGCAQNSSTEPSQQENQQENQQAEAEAVKFPTKPIQIIVPSAAGGGSDITARAIAKVGEKIFGQAMVVVCRPGGATTVGTNEVVQAAPDGYTLLYGTVGGIAVQPHYGGVNYTYSDLVPIAHVASEPNVFVAKKGKFKDLADFVNIAKAQPGALKYGVSSIGGTVHIVVEQFLYQANVDVKGLGFTGDSEVAAAILGGHIDAGILTPQEVKPYYDSGDMMVLGIAEPERIQLLPDAPTFKEQGYDVELSVWKGIFAPKGISDDVKKVLVEGFQKILTDKSFVDEMAKGGQVITYLDPDEFGAKVEKEYNMYGEIIKNAGIADKVNAMQKK